VNQEEPEGAPRQDEHDFPADVVVDNGPPGANDDDYFAPARLQNNAPVVNELRLGNGNTRAENVVVNPMAQYIIEPNQGDRRGSVVFLHGFSIQELDH